MSIFSQPIYLDDPNLGAGEEQYVQQAIASRFVSTAGPFVPEFERIFAAFLNIPSAVSTQSGTAAIHIALYELGIGRQPRWCGANPAAQTEAEAMPDEVIVPALTFAASVSPILHVGAKPVFVDVDPATWNMLPAAVEQAITPRTKAILPVHLYGNPCEMDTILAIARQYHLSVIEDATESLGATYQGQYTGTFGDLGAFSFNGNKIITTGGGGMVIGPDEQRLRHIKFLVNQARDETRGYYHPEIGFNYRMTNIEAALGLAQMQRVDAFLAQKRAFHKIYREELRGVRGLRLQEVISGAVSSYWLSCIRLEREGEVADLQQQLKANGIPTRRIFVPVVAFPPYQIAHPETFPNAASIYARGLCLPSSTLNTPEAIAYVCQTLKEIL